MTVDPIPTDLIIGEKIMGADKLTKRGKLVGGIVGGGVGVDGVLDYSASADFTALGPPNEYAFTGENLKNSFKAADYNYNMKFTKPKVEGDVFAQPDSLLKPQGTTKAKDYAGAALNAALSGQNEDPNGAVQFASLKATDPNSMISGSGGTSGAYTKEGLLLNEAQKAFFRNQNLDIIV